MDLGFRLFHYNVRLPLIKHHGVIDIGYSNWVLGVRRSTLWSNVSLYLSAPILRFC